jgi:hypothetical protein
MIPCHEFRMKDLVPLASLNNLSSLVLRNVGNQTNICALTQCKTLTCITLDGVYSVIYITALPVCLCLEHLVLGEVQYSSLSSLEACTRLKILYIRDARNINDVTALATCTQLSQLDLRHMQSLGNIAGLRSCALLECISIVDLSKLEDINPLSGCKSLMYAYFQHCHNIVDITALSKCKNLQHLTLKNCSGVLNTEGCHT